MNPAFRRTALFCTAAALVFYGWQNHFAAHGGTIALPKALWLGLTVFYWLALPVLVFRPHNRQPEKPLKLAYLLFWLPMAARALAELWLLYVSGGWRYAYGIAHDLFSAVWLLALWAAVRRSQPRPLVLTLPVMAAMFLAESGFARYIAAFNHGREHAALWFIGWQPPHLANQLITAACVAALTGWLVYLDRKL